MTLETWKSLLPVIRKLESVEVLDESDRRAVAMICDSRRTTRRRHDVISIGDSSNIVHVILSGWAARYAILPNGARRITAILLPGDFCDMDVTMLSTRDYSVTALTDCEVAYVDRFRLTETTRSAPGLARALWRCSLIDGAVLRQWLASSGRRDALGSLSHLLCELHSRARSIKLCEDDRLNLPLTQEDLGDACGITSVHVNRVIRRLREGGMLTINNGMLEILDLPTLRRSCGFDPRYLHLRQGSG